MSQSAEGPLGKAVKECEEAIRYQDKETVGAFNQEGVELVRKTGDAQGVTLSDEDLERLRGAAVLTHNHPQGSSFSDQDVALACSLEVGELRVVSEHWTHCMRVPGGALNPDLWDAGLEEAIRRWFHEVRREVGEEIGRRRLTVEDANVEFWHLVWIRVAAEVGLEYVRVGARE